MLQVSVCVVLFERISIRFTSVFLDYSLCATFNNLFSKVKEICEFFGGFLGGFFAKV